MQHMPVAFGLAAPCTDLHVMPNHWAPVRHVFAGSGYDIIHPVLVVVDDFTDVPKFDAAGTIFQASVLLNQTAGCTQTCQWQGGIFCSP